MDASGAEQMEEGGREGFGYSQLHRGCDPQRGSRQNASPPADAFAARTPLPRGRLCRADAFNPRTLIRQRARRAELSL